MHEAFCSCPNATSANSCQPLEFKRNHPETAVITPEVGSYCDKQTESFELTLVRTNMIKAIAIKEHISNYPKPIEFKKYDELEIGEFDTEYDGWVKVTVRNGDCGWAPIQYVEMNGKSTLGRAIQDYSAVELAVYVGEQLEIDHELNGWCWIKNKKGEFGWVPAETLKLA